MKIRVHILALTLLVSLPLAAQEEGTEQGPPTAPSTAQWSLGLGVISSPRPYVGAENNVMAIPIIGLNYKKLYIQGIQAGYHFVNNENFTFDARVGIVFAGLDPDDSPFLEGMEKRGSTVEGGFFFDWKPGKFRLSASAYTDLLGRSDGQQAALDFSRSWRFNRSQWGITPSIGFVWQSSSFVDYYFGVSPEEARPGRPLRRTLGRQLPQLAARVLLRDHASTAGGSAAGPAFGQRDLREPDRRGPTRFLRPHRRHLAVRQAAATTLLIQCLSIDSR